MGHQQRMSSEQPKKPKSKKLNVTTKSRWKGILKDVEKKEIPIRVLQKITVSLKDGTQVDVNIKELLDEGQDPAVVEYHLNSKLESLDDIIESVDFFVDIDSVAATIQPETDRLLANL